MISNKDIYLEEHYRSISAAEAAMRQEYEAHLAWEALMAWADDRIRQAESFFLDLRETGLQPVAMDPADAVVPDEYAAFLAGEWLQPEGRAIVFHPEQPVWRMPA